MVTYLGPSIPTLGPFLIGQLLAYGPPISLMPFLMSKMYSRIGRGTFA